MVLRDTGELEVDTHWLKLNEINGEYKVNLPGTQRDDGPPLQIFSTNQVEFIYVTLGAT